jgi:hypothetical protein
MSARFFGSIPPPDLVHDNERADSRFEVQGFKKDFKGSDVNTVLADPAPAFH